MRRVISKHSQNIPMINVRVSQIHDDSCCGAAILVRWSTFCTASLEVHVFDC
jgi:hypothetical protein